MAGTTTFEIITGEAAIDDDALVRAIARGDRRALATLYRRYLPLLTNVARRLLRNERDAEDLVQDFFVEIWRCAGSYDRKRGTVRTWLLIRLRCRAIDRIRTASRARFVDLDCREDVAVTKPIETTDLCRARRAIQALRPTQRQVIELRYFEGLSTSEIAERVNTPIGTVKSRVAAALVKLREQLHVTTPITACAAA